MHAGVKLPAAPSSKFGIFAQSSLLSIDHVLVGKWQGGSKPLRLYQPSRWAELAKTREGSVEEREKGLWISEAAFCQAPQERVLHAGVAGGRVANTG